MEGGIEVLCMLYLNTSGFVVNKKKITSSDGGFSVVSDCGYFGSSIAMIGDLDEDDLNEIVAGPKNSIGFFLVN